MEGVSLLEHEHVVWRRQGMYQRKYRELDILLNKGIGIRHIPQKGIGREE